MGRRQSPLARDLRGATASRKRQREHPLLPPLLKGFHVLLAEDCLEGLVAGGVFFVVIQEGVIVLHKEPLLFENVQPSVRSYK